MKTIEELIAYIGAIEWYVCSIMCDKSGRWRVQLAARFDNGTDESYTTYVQGDSLAEALTTAFGFAQTLKKASVDSLSVAGADMLS